MWHLSFRTWAGLTWKQDRQILDFYVGPMFNFKWASQNSYQWRLIPVDKTARGGHNQVYRHIPGSKMTLGQRWQWLAHACSQWHMQRWANAGYRYERQQLFVLRQPTVRYSSSILYVFANSGPTLAQGNKANCHFVKVSPQSATDVYPLCICQHWANVGSR